MSGASPFKGPEIATVHGALDDEAFGDGSVLSAHVARTMIRDGNRLAARGHYVFTRRERASVPSGGEDPQHGLRWAPPFWSRAFPLFDPYPVEKAFGLTKLKLAVRAEVTSGMSAFLCVRTSRLTSPDGVLPADMLELVGSGSLHQYTQADIPCRKGDGEEIGFWLKAVCLDSDADLDTATYGGVAFGSARAVSPGRFSRARAQWNVNGLTVDRAGYRVEFRDAWDRIVHTAQIIGLGTATGAGRTDELDYWPPAPTQAALTGTTFFIKKLPEVRIPSCVLYAQRRTEP